MIKKVAHNVILFFFIFLRAEAQIGGDNTFEFLNLVPSPHAAALGGNAIGTHADDVSLVWQNPSQLSSTMDKQLQLSFVDYFEGINFGQVAYAHDFKETGTFGATMHYINYGSFTMTDEAANELGTFKAAEYALALSWNKPLNKYFSIGSALKGIYSHLETYSTTGIAADIAFNYYHEKHFFDATIIAKNIGRQFGEYDAAGNEPLPFEMQLGLSKKLPKAPFRFGLTWQHLQKFDITFDDPLVADVDQLTGESNDTKISFVEKCARHLVLNTELLLSKNFNVRIGYNFQRRNELSIENKKGIAGFTGGFGVKISKFQINYARVVYQLKGASNHFSVGVKLSDFSKK